MFRAIISPILRSARLYLQAASSVHYTTSCKYSLALLMMGEIIAKNMLSWLKLLIKWLLLHLVGCLYYYINLSSWYSPVCDHIEKKNRNLTLPFPTFKGKSTEWSLLTSATRCRNERLLRRSQLKCDGTRAENQISSFGETYKSI